MTETLSDKIEDNVQRGNFISQMIHVQDVREFIQKLKEELTTFVFHSDDWERTEEIIDTLAGKELATPGQNHSPQMDASQGSSNSGGSIPPEDTQKGCGKLFEGHAQWGKKECGKEGLCPACDNLRIWKEDKTFKELNREEKKA